MKKLLWVLVVGLLAGIIVTLVAEKRAAEGSRVRAMGGRIRSTAGQRPHLPSANLKQPLDEAIEGAAGELTGATAGAADGNDSA